MEKTVYLQAGKAVKVWWSRSPSSGNFGDILTPLIFRHYGISCEYESIKKAEAVCVGSVARLARAGMIVLGSGAMSCKDPLEPLAQYRFVRGPLTRELILKAGGECPAVYGDPALVIPEIYQRTQEAESEIGIVNHYVDGGEISPLLPPRHFLNELWKFKRIISSSLHGIIAAHAYGIPAAWVRTVNKLDGDDTKFHDYALSVGLDQMPISTIDNPEFTLPKITLTAGIENEFKKLRDEYLRT